MSITNCVGCKKHISFHKGFEYCEGELWQRCDEESKEWLESDDDYTKYINKSIFCSEYEPKKVTKEN
ncbi:MAG: hypothetical protein DRH97_00435 [Chloroflexi bacterium]|nr:MAG: hypothetical protein DRH97_00435 [Chloroflexota bacterium]